MKGAARRLKRMWPASIIASCIGWLDLVSVSLGRGALLNLRVSSPQLKGNNSNIKRISAYSKYSIIYKP